MTPERRSVTVEPEDAPCDHKDDDGGSAIMQASGDRYECIVCGERFRLLPAEPTEPAGALDVDAFLASFAWRTELNPSWRDGIEYVRHKFAHIVATGGWTPPSEPRADSEGLDVERLIRAVIDYPDWDRLPASIREAAQPWLPTADDVRGILAPSEPRADSEGLREAAQAYLASAKRAALRREQPAAEGEREVRVLRCERNESSASAHGHTDECYR